MALFYWALFLSILIISFRFLAAMGISLLGIIDDLSFFFIGVAIFGLLSKYLNKTLASSVLSFIGITSIILYLSNILFYRFFKTYINIESITMFNQVNAVTSSILNLGDAYVFAFILALPLCFLSMSIFKLKPSYSHWDGRLHEIAMVMFIISSSTVIIFKEDVLIPSQNNIVSHLVRQYLGKIYETNFLDQKKYHSLMVKKVNRLFNFPDSESYEQVLPLKYPLYKVAVSKSAEPETKMNIVLVLLESVRYFERHHFNHPDFMPNLKRLSREGLSFPNIYANGTQTVRGELAVLCSIIPYFKGGQVYSIYPELSAKCLPEILNDVGYSTAWFNGYKRDFAKGDIFLYNHGINNFFDIDNIEKSGGIKEGMIGLGVSDNDMILYAVDMIGKLKEPFFAEIMTLSNHHPFNGKFGVSVPESLLEKTNSTLYNRYLQGNQYTDFAIGKLIEKAKEKSWFDNTLFIFIGDHGVQTFPASINGHSIGATEEAEIYFRMGAIFWSPKYLSSAVNLTIGSQIDIAPTILDLIGLYETNSFSGISLLDSMSDDKRFAIMVTENTWNIRQGDYYCYALGQSCFNTIYPYCEDGQRPAVTGHTCFKLNKDILDFQVNHNDMAFLYDNSRGELLSKGKDVLEINNYLLRNNLFFPVGQQEGFNKAMSGDSINQSE